MGNYITSTEVNAFLSSDQVNKLLTYGNQTDTTTKINLLIDAAESEVDSYLLQAGYSIPLTTVPSKIKIICIYFVIYDLYGASYQPIPEALESQRTNQLNYLARLRDKRIQLPNNTQDPDIGIGANLVVTNLDSTSQTATVCTLASMKGTWM